MVLAIEARNWKPSQFDQEVGPAIIIDIDPPGAQASTQRVRNAELRGHFFEAKVSEIAIEPVRLGVIESRVEGDVEGRSKPARPFEGPRALLIDNVVAEVDRLATLLAELKPEKSGDRKL